MISSEQILRPGVAPGSAERRESDQPVVRIFNDYGEEVFTPGQWAQAGTYRQVDSNRVVVLEVAGPLPPSFDGRRAEYTRIERPWLNLNAQ